MHFFYVKQNVQLTLPHKQKLLIAPGSEALAQQCIPIENIYGGFIFWEYNQAQKLIGESNACLVDAGYIGKELLPKKIESFCINGDIISQLQQTLRLQEAASNRPAVRIALVNGTGTMLGDSIVGSSILSYVGDYLASQGIDLSVDAYVAWNAKTGVEEIWKRTPYVNEVHGSSPTIAKLRHYDAYWDYSHLLHMDGYGTEQFGDFYFNHFGLDYARIDPTLKIPSLKVSQREFELTRELISKQTCGEPLIFVQADASTPARSMPECFLTQLLKLLASRWPGRIVITRRLPDGLSDQEQTKIINLLDWTKDNLDRYISAIALSSHVVSVDTMALHVAMGCHKPGIGLFALSRPEIRLKYSTQIQGILIEGAAALPYWNRHKSDEQWATVQETYETAWMQLRLPELVESLISS